MRAAGSRGWRDGTERRLGGEIVASSASWADFDGDGEPDLLLTDTGAPEVSGDEAIRILLGCGGRLGEILAAQPDEQPPIVAYGLASTVADLDGDGRPDAVVAYTNRIDAYLNRGGGAFEAQTLWREKGLVNAQSTFVAALPIGGALHLYLGREGDVFDPRSRDPAIANLLLRRTKDGWADVAGQYPALLAAGRFNTLAVAWISRVAFGGPPLLFVGNDGAPDGLLRFEGGSFEAIALPTAGWVRETATMGADYRYRDDGDGVDLVLTDIGRLPAFHIPPDGPVEDISDLLETQRHYVTWGLAFGDFDNDGDEDLAIAAGFSELLLSGPPPPGMVKTGALLYYEAVDGRLVDRTEALGPPFGVGGRDLFTLTTADLDRDGCLDFAVSARMLLEGNTVVANTSARIIENRCDPAHGWIGFEVPDDPGAMLALTLVLAGGRRVVRYREVKALAGAAARSWFGQVHFGLGDAEVVESLRITWADGTAQTVLAPEPGRYHRIARLPDGR